MSKRRRTEETEIETSDLPIEAIEALQEFVANEAAVVKKKSRKKKGKRRPRTPSIKLKLLKKLRLKKRTLTKQLRAVDRDIRSLSGRKKTKQQ